MKLFDTLKIGDRIYRKNISPANIYTITGFYDNHYGADVEDESGDKHQLCASTINDYYFPVIDVSHPDYYNSHPSGIECIEVARHFCFSIGNAIKYLWRAGLKKDMSLTDKQKEIEDLKKAIWYINDRIEQLHKEQS